MRSDGGGGRNQVESMCLCGVGVNPKCNVNILGKEGGRGGDWRRSRMSCSVQ